MFISATQIIYSMIISYMLMSSKNVIGNKLKLTCTCRCLTDSEYNPHMGLNVQANVLTQPFLTLIKTSMKIVFCKIDTDFMTCINNYLFQDISKQGDLILMSQFLIHGENGVMAIVIIIVFNNNNLVSQCCWVKTQFIIKWYPIISRTGWHQIMPNMYNIINV